LGAHLGFDPQQPADHNVTFWLCLGLLAALGFLGLSLQLIPLWVIWTNDPLRSIGMLIVPASLILTLRAWRRRKWELHGTWWGLLPAALAFFPIVFSRELTVTWVAGFTTVFLVPRALPIYLYASGVVLLFAGKRVWRQAWFPLALLLLAQPVPAVAVQFLDLPLQSLSARIARMFANGIGFPPTNQELLRLMFTPDFGMFIAPGCDGMRGAITLGYLALIVGYLKRASILRWLLYVLGAVFLGHLFNLIRLCALVLYYRIAAGHPALERVAKQADYAIGGSLLLIAAILFLWIAFRDKDENHNATDGLAKPSVTATTKAEVHRRVYRMIAAFAVLVLIADVPGIRTIRDYRGSMVASLNSGDLTEKNLNDLMPKQLGDYRLIRLSQEQYQGETVLENGVYGKDPTTQFTLGIWISPREHSIHWSRLAHGESPQMRADRSFLTAQGQPVAFDTAYYSNGVTDSLEGNTYCSPSFCRLSAQSGDGLHMSFKETIDFRTRGARFIPIFFRAERTRTSAPEADTYKALSAEARAFLSGVNCNALSERFQ